MRDLSEFTEARERTEPIRQWLLALFALSANNMPRAEIEARLDAYVPVLTREFPSGAYTEDSLAYVARQCTFAPAYGEVSRNLAAWWRDNRPMPAALPPPPPEPPRTPPTPEEAAAVHEMVRDLVASLRASDTRRAEALAADRHSYLPPGSVPPRHLPPDMLDRLNPLPNGHKRAG